MQKRVFILISVIIFFAACSRNTFPQSFTEMPRSAEIDYNDINNWSAHPWKKDPSDSVPLPLLNTYKPDSSVDVFFIHPTTFLDKELLNKDSTYDSNASLWNANLNNEAINHKTDASSILYQASIFNEAGRVFAPRYRQANYYAYFTSDTKNAQLAFDFAYEDVKKSFEFYLEHYNNGRPIVIAAHSQGTTHAKRLLKEFFDGKPLMKQLVVAYLVGMPVEENYYTNIPVCSTPEQTGCQCSWRTFKEGYMSDFAKKETYNALVTNPLSWDTSSTFVDREKNKGAVLLNFKKVIPGTTGGRIYKNVLWVNRPRFFGSLLSRQKNYHIGDLNLFYMSVRENVEERIKAYKSNQDGKQ